MRVELKEAPPAATPTSGPKAANPSRVYWVIAYVALVLLVDTLAANGVRVPFDWTIFSWTPTRVHEFLTNTLSFPAGLTGWMVTSTPGVASAPASLFSVAVLFSGFDFFKFIFWLVIPLAFSIRRFEGAWWGWRRIKRPERWLLVAAPFVAIAAMFLIPYLPGLSQYYQQISGRVSWDQKLAALIHHNIYTVSWLIGWEFLHRYFLLRAVERRWPRWGWLLVPLSETLYHLQKPGVEALAMGIFSLFMTRYTVVRRNALWPLIIHWIIENALLIFLLAG